MTPYQPQDDDQNLMENLIRQKRLESAFGNAGIPQAQNREPDVFHHVQHSFDSPSQGSGIPQPVQQSQGQLDSNQEAALQTGVAPSPSTPTPTPVPKVGPINPTSAKPAESAYLQSLQNEPMHANYHPSGLRKFAGVMGGIGAGILSRDHVAGGMAADSAIVNGPFNKQHSDWKQFAANKGVQATEEAANEATGGKEALTAAQILEQTSLAGLHNKQSNIIAPDMATDVANKETIRQASLKVDTREVKMKDGSIRHLVQQNGIFIDPETKEKVSRSAIDDFSDEGKTLRQTKIDRIPGNLGASVKAKQIMAEGVDGPNKYDQATVDAATEFDKKLTEGKDPQGAFARIVFDRNKERELAGKKPMSSQEEEDLQMKLLSVQKPPQALMEDPNTHVAFAAKPGVSIPQGATTPQQSGANAAKDAKEQEDMQADKRFVNDYLKNQTHTGPGDEALLERFFNATKPSTGFRMNQAQIALLTRLRSFSSSAKAFMAHATGGTLFDDKQRGEIVDAINKVIDSKSKGPNQSQNNGITLQDIDAEIARRKGKK